MITASKSSPDYDLAQLQLNLRAEEAIRHALFAIKAGRDQGVTMTVGSHDYDKLVPINSLVLILDPDGATAAPDGTTLVCRGTAWIASETIQVAVCRKD